MDLIIGLATDFDWPQLEPYAVSLHRTGYDGEKALLSHNLTPLAIENLTNLGFKLIPLEGQDIHAHAYRHFAVWKYLVNSTPFRYVICSDVKDVIFQRDPTKFLEKEFAFREEQRDPNYGIVAASECMWYRNTVWGRNNMSGSFSSEIADWMSTKEMCCAGTLAGDGFTMGGLLLSIYLLSKGSINKYESPDQAAYNILINQDPYRTVTRVPYMKEGFILTAHNLVVEPAYKPFLIDEPPTFDEENGLVLAPGSGIPFCMVHQYDRVPLWNNVLRKKHTI